MKDLVDIITEVNEGYSYPSYDLTDPIQVSQCCNYKNHQPLWINENRSKGSKYEK